MMMMMMISIISIKIIFISRMTTTMMLRTMP